MFGSGLLRDRRDMLRACHRVKDDHHQQEQQNHALTSKMEFNKPQAPPSPPRADSPPTLANRPTLGKWGFAPLSRE